MLSNDVWQNGVRKSNQSELYVSQDPDTAMLRPAGMPACQLFLDTFDSGVLDVAARWTSTVSVGTVTTTVGNCTLSSGAGANSYAKIQSQFAFLPTQPGFLFGYKAINLEYPLVAGGYRFWGLATVPGSPTYANPITEAMGFEVFTDGKMYAVTYQTGVRVVIADLSAATGNNTAPTDALPHKYFTYFRGDVGYWCIDNQDNVVAKYITGAGGPNVNTLKITAITVAGGATPMAISINGVTMGDTAHTTYQLADGTFGWRKAAVNSAGALSTTTTGTVTAAPAGGTIQTYSSSFNVAAAAAATDIATLSGSASKVVNVTKIIISGTQTTGGVNDVMLVKRSTADTGGTSTAQTAVPHDSGDAAATGVVLAYTANPAALGTAVGTFRRGYLPVVGATSIVNPVVVFDFGFTGKPIVLRGIAQQIAVNLNGATLTGGAFDINIEWYES